MALLLCAFTRFVFALAGGAAYTAGYTRKSSDQLGEWAEGVSAVGTDIGQGFGALLGSVRNGLNSSARFAPPPAPTITHVYHDRGSDRGSSLVPILVVAASGVTCYWVVCWYKGWDFFGMSHARTQELITSLNSSTSMCACALGHAVLLLCPLFSSACLSSSVELLARAFMLPFLRRWQHCLGIDYIVTATEIVFMGVCRCQTLVTVCMRLQKCSTKCVLPWNLSSCKCYFLVCRFAAASRDTSLLICCTQHLFIRLTILGG
jgi:hypothetical protein